MLGNLRSRRRPRYGAHVCAVIAALTLLLLSVSLLHTRLSQPHLLHQQHDTVSSSNSQNNPLTTDQIITSFFEDEDKIDELDVIEEDQQNDAVSTEEDDQQEDNDKISSSGYFFDHIHGSIRRVFNKKRSIDNWDYDYANFYNEDVKYKDKAVFGSDDVAVDEEIRRKIGEVVGIEDVLLLKIGKRVSPLREKWGDWFDKKSDFLRKDKMFKSNVEVLNPLSNPMLQDPDGVGVTGLTRGDKLVQKWLFNEFKRVPFLVKKKPLGVLETTRKGENLDDVERRSEIKRAERRTLDDNLSNVDENLSRNGDLSYKSDNNSNEDLSEIKRAERRTLDDNLSNGGSVSKRENNVNEDLSLRGNGNLSNESSRSSTSKIMKDSSIGELGKLNGEFHVYERRSEIKRAEQRTLDDNLSNVNENLSRNGNLSYKSYNNSNEDLSLRGNGNLSNESSRSSKIMKDLSIGELGKLDGKAKPKSEFSSHVYADGKRWGYYPGLHPHLSFSDFMDTFFRKGKCDMRVFMVWNSPPWMYSVRHQRGLESMLSHHRDACVVVFSETIELDFFKDSFLKDGYKVAVAMPNLDELLKDTPSHIFASVWYEWRKTKFYSTHYSELVRLAALYKYGGIYLDSDIIVLKSLSSLDNSVGLENQLAGSSLNGAVMAFQKQSPFIMECLKEFYLTYDDTRLRWNGADLLTRVARNVLREISSRQRELKVQPSFIFFPISSQNITRYFITPATEIEKAQQDVLFKKILNESLTFHFWNSLTYALIPEPDSLVSRLIDHPCIRCFDVL